MENKKPSTSRLKKQRQKHVMISYNWKDSQQIAHKVCDELCNVKYPLWIDRDKMKGELYDQMAQAVEDAYVILVFLSPNYETSRNCQLEASYALKSNKHIIPILTQKNYEPKGMCGLLAASKIYVDFSNGSFDEKFQELLRELGDPVPHDSDQHYTQEVKEVTKQVQDLTVGSQNVTQNEEQSTRNKNLLEVESSQPEETPARNKETIKPIETLLNQIKLFSNKKRWSKADGLQLLFLWVQLNEFEDPSPLVRAAEHFPTKLDLSDIPLEEREVIAMSEVLKYTNKEIEKIILKGCQLRTSFRHFSSALLESNSTVKKLEVSWNKLPDLDEVIVLIPRITKWLSLYFTFTNGRGGERHPNTLERRRLQKALDENNTTRLKVVVGVFTILRANK